MTRINVIDPSQLTDQHAMAEYRELPMVMGALRRSLVAKNGMAKPGSSYTLNAGHVRFFFNKGDWLKRRYYALVMELLERGYHLDPARRADFTVFENNGLNGSWCATEEALHINRERIQQRILAKPDWYKYNRKPIVDLVEYDMILNPTKIWNPT